MPDLRGALVVLALAGVIASCAPGTPGASATPAPSISPVPTATPVTPAVSATPGTLSLVTPAAGAVVTQNDPALTTTCPASATRGSGYSIDFSWTGPAGVAGIAGFQVVLQHGSSIPIVLDVDGSTTTSFTELACNTFVIDNNLTAWHWKVNAVGSAKQVLATSEQRSLTFGPCRLAGGAPCNANV